MRFEEFSPEWIAWQAKFPRGRSKYLSKVKLVRDFVDYLHARGEKVTYESIRTMLKSLNRSYGLSRQEIHQGMQHSRARTKMPFRPNGRRVKVGDKIYRSIREAAKFERCRQATVKARVETGFPGWSFVD